MSRKLPRSRNTALPALATTSLTASPLVGRRFGGNHSRSYHAGVRHDSPAYRHVDSMTSITFAFILPFTNQAGLLTAIDGMHSPDSAT